MIYYINLTILYTFLSHFLDKFLIIWYTVYGVRT